jgi:hypothetical protein
MLAADRIETTHRVPVHAANDRKPGNVLQRGDQVFAVHQRHAAYLSVMLAIIAHLASARYTDARPILRAFAMADGPCRRLLIHVNNCGAIVPPA